MNPVKYLTNKVQLSVTNAMEVQPETAEQPETEEPTSQDNEPEDEAESPVQQLKPTVVDLTDMSPMKRMNRKALLLTSRHRHPLLSMFRCLLSRRHQLKASQPRHQALSLRWQRTRKKRMVEQWQAL